MKYLRNYLYNVLCVFSNALNAIIFLGDPDESVSSRLGKAQRGDYGPWATLATAAPAIVLDWVMARIGLVDHCRRSIEEDRGDASVFGRQEVV